MKRHAASATALLALAGLAPRAAAAADAGTPGPPAASAAAPHAGAAPRHPAAAARQGAPRHAPKQHAAGAGAPADAGAADAAPADAQTDAPSLLVGAPDGGPADQGAVTASCIEHLPQGKHRPKLTEKLPSRGVSGHVATLTVTVEHGKGETVLPNGFHLQLGGDSEHALERAGFALPNPDGGAGPTIKTKTKGQRATTTVKIPLVPLPEKPGRQKLTLPPLPIAIARASGEVITLCTTTHEITVSDPTASTPHAKPHDNPKPRRQMEEWTTARDITYAALIALVVGALVAWLLGRWLRRPRPQPPPPPPRPPWEVALEELFDIRHAGLINEQRFSEHFDRVSHTVRKYLGDRYGFDGLESTTREILGFIGRVTPAVSTLPEIEVFLREADLVKFARLTPTEQDCETALGRGEQIVHSTIPPLSPGGAPAAAPQAGGATGPAPEKAGDRAAAAPEPRSPYAPPLPGEQSDTETKTREAPAEEQPETATAPAGEAPAEEQPETPGQPDDAKPPEAPEAQPETADKTHKPDENGGER